MATNTNLPGGTASGRNYSVADRLLMRLQALSGLAEEKASYPAEAVADRPLDRGSRRHAAGLMRVNHAGEVSAQALYHGQALVARDNRIREHLLQAAGEERAHLRWCATRLTELKDRPSLLSPFWYAGSFAIGALAGLTGDGLSLGFVEETERQVAEHLEDHLRQLPPDDARSRAIVRAMQEDEMRHGNQAHEAGARPLPLPVRELMRRAARVMKFGAYRV